jgi:hypothetical protein
MQRTAAFVAEENLEQGDHFKIPHSKPAVATRKGRNVFGSRDSEAVLLQSGVHCVTASSSFAVTHSRQTHAGQRKGSVMNE